MRSRVDADGVDAGRFASWAQSGLTWAPAASTRQRGSKLAAVVDPTAGDHDEPAALVHPPRPTLRSSPRVRG